MVIAGLYMDLCVHIVPPNPKISKFVWGNFQSPAPDAQEHLKKNRPAGLIYSLTCSIRCTHSHVRPIPVALAVAGGSWFPAYIFCGG